MASFQEAEKPEIPAVCDSCLGLNPYIEMVRDRNGAECKLCTRPYTTFEWKSGMSQQQRRKKRTIICLTCARSKNCCQVCMLDLTYGLDLALRDSILKLAGEEQNIPGGGENEGSLNKISKVYKANQLDHQYKNGMVLQDEEAHSKENDEKAKTILMKVAKSKLDKPKQANDKSQIKKKDISKTDLNKIVAKLPFNGNLIPTTTDESNNEKDGKNSIFVFGISENLPQYMIANFFEQRSGSVPLKAISINHKARCGFVTLANQKLLSQVCSQLLKDNDKPETYARPLQVIIDSVPVRLSLAKLRPLGTTNEDFYKLAMVVQKQMKVLADKDAKDGV